MLYLMLFHFACIDTSNDLILDVDGDGLSPFNGDCDDSNENAQYTTNDADCDGVAAEEDCDDNNAESTFKIDDADCDGVVTEEEARESYKNGGWKNAYNGKPFYHHPWFDWSKTKSWINDRNAINYWIKSRGGSQGQLTKIKQGLFSYRSNDLGKNIRRYFCFCF